MLAKLLDRASIAFDNSAILLKVVNNVSTKISNQTLVNLCVWGGGGWVSVDRRLFHRCGASVDLELSCLETLLSLEVKGSSEGILYDEIYIMIIEK